MHTGSYVFTQIVECIPRRQFDQCVQRYAGDYKVRELSCREQFLALMFGQLTHLESLRDIVTCLSAQRNKLYHLGFNGPVARSTLARANKIRNWRIYRDFAYYLIERARKLYGNDLGSMDGLDAKVYALDASIVDLCLSWFPWATFRKQKGGIKLHVLLDLGSGVPAIFHVTKASVHELNIMDRINWEEDALYIMDRGYTDFKRLYRINSEGAYFIIRAKHNLSFRRTYSRPVNTSTGLRCDQTIRLRGAKSSRLYPKRLRRIKYYDAKTDRYYVFLTNNFKLPSLQIAEFYKYRWQIELFFKWVKQHVKVQVFWGRSENAVKIQVCAAICAYVLIAILKKRLRIEREMHEMLQILRVSMFDKIGLLQLFSDDSCYDDTDLNVKQGVFIGF
jgi:hypothetical protein